MYGVDTHWNHLGKAIPFEPVHYKTYIKTCVTSKGSDQSVQPPSMKRVLFYPSLASLEAVEDTCNQQRLSSDCAGALADMNLSWSHVLL